MFHSILWNYNIKTVNHWFIYGEIKPQDCFEKFANADLSKFTLYCVDSVSTLKGQQEAAIKGPLLFPTANTAICVDFLLILGNIAQELNLFYWNVNEREMLRDLTAENCWTS